jgi:hypothetical protein
LAATGVLVAALAAGCNKGGGGGGAGGGATGGGVAEAVKAAAATPLDFIPKDAVVVFGVNWSKFKGTKFYNMIIANLPPDAKTEMDGVKAACGIDPLNDLDSVTVGVVGNLDKSSKAVVVIKGNWTEDKLAKCATAMGEKKGKKMTVAKDGNLTTYTPEGEKAVTVGWANDLMVFSSATAETGDKAHITEIMKKATAVKDNKGLMDLMGKTDQTGTIWGAFTPPAGSEMAGAFGQMTGGSEKLAGAYGTIKLASDLDINCGFRFATDADAKSVADKMNKQIEAVKSSPQGAFLTNMSIAATGADTVVKLKLDEKQLDQITEMVKQMAPMIMGGMLGGGQQ